MLILLVSSSSISAQEKVSYKKQKYAIKKLGEVNPLAVQEDYQPKVSNLEMPSPGSSKFALKQLKKKSAKQFPRTTPLKRSWKTSESSSLTIESGFPLATYLYVPALDDTIVTYLSGGIPNDNTLSIGNNGYMVTAYNSSIFAYDTNLDTLLFKISLHAFTAEFTLNDKYDPKVLYDPISDRFILVFLNGRLSTNMRIIVCFSSTNDPRDPWNLYELPGNPLNDTTWTDYPAIAITENELFVTGNLLRDNEPWQTGFSQTIIWQVNLEEGYTGDTTLTTQLWTDIAYGGKNVRNINPVQGGSSPLDSAMYLLSNRNFTLLSDTIFLIEIDGTIDNPSASLSIDLGITDTPYGAPPLGRQEIGEDSLSTNDARILGAFIENGEIQYVANTINSATGFAGVYHGFINDLNNTPVFTGTILSDDTLDFGYPNIAYTGDEACSRQSVIAFNHSSPWHWAGVSAVMYNSDSEYSDRITLKKGDAAIDRLNGPERWGDYFGIQRKYDTPNKVWTAGYYSKDNGINYTWASELLVSQDNTLSASITDSTDQSNYGSGDATATLSIQGGNVPYSIVWNDNNEQTTETAENLSAGTYFVSITDNKNCSVSDSVSFVETAPLNNIFPNPSNDIVNVFFEMELAEMVYIELYDAKGSLIKMLYQDQVKAGENLFTFSISPLSIGGYLLKINTEEKEVLSEKIIKY
ncbi:MAG: T9SS type A sorting domain-containing protein [Flavobacteriales bacterium]|nr:T9SS type A sorting domain-containing protein [Flavobacteriales bacterium]